MTRTRFFSRFRRRRPDLPKPPLECKLCEERAQVQLCRPDAMYEMLCFDHLGYFLETWTDRRITEWTVVLL